MLAARPAAARALASMLAVLLLGCGDGPVATTAWRTFSIQGDHASGLSGASVELAVRVETANGTPAPGVAVSWEARVNGSIEDAESVTDGNGTARARFVLGPAPGAATAVARIPGAAPVVFTLESRADPTLLPYDVVTGLAFQTFDGSGEVVHPDYAVTPGWSFEHQLAITPYPNGNPNFELPSLFSSRTDLGWSLAPGTPNPVLPAPGSGYLSDPDVVSVPETGELWLYYRQVTDQNLIYLVRSNDGIQWSAPELVVATPNHEIISPAVVRRAPGDWWMWSVNGGAVGCGASRAQLEVRRSPNGRAWGPPRPLGLSHDPLTPWHVDVQWIPSRSEFWALYNVKQPGTCTTPAIYLATSPDGIDWTPTDRPVLTKGVTPAFQDIVYRSTFEYRPSTGDVVFWFSGARYQNGRWVWSGAVERRHAADLFGGALAKMSFRAPPAELEDWP